MKIRPMTGERDAIAVRAARIPADATIRGLPFEGVAAALVQAFDQATADAIAHDAGIVGGARFKRLAKYSLRDFVKVEQLAAAKLAGVLGGYDEAVFRIGSAAVELFFDSIAGRTMRVLAGDDPHRLLGNVPEGYDFLVSYGARRYEKTGPRSGRFKFDGEFLGPVHSAGIFDAGIRQVYGVEATFKLVQSSAVDFTFDVSW